MEESSLKASAPLLVKKAGHVEEGKEGGVVYLISPGCNPVMGDNRAKQ